MNMQNVKLAKGKEITQHPYRDLNWRSYFSESDNRYVIRQFNPPFQGSLEFYRDKFIQEHVALLVLAELGLAPAAEMFFEKDEIFYRHKHLVLFQMNPGAEIIGEVRSSLEGAGFILPPEISFTRMGIDPSGGEVKLFSTAGLVTSHLPLEELLIKVQPKVHGYSVSEYLLVDPMIKTAQDYPPLLEVVANGDWVSWAKTYLLDFLDTPDLYIQESKNIPFIKRALKSGGSKLRLKK